MRILVRRSAVQGLLALMHRALFGAAVCLLGYCAFVFLDARIFQESQLRQLDLAAVRTASAKVPSAAVAANGMLGRIDIPRLGISAVFLEGTTAKTLRRAVGHIPGSAAPGQAGNVVLSGHRDSFFRPLRNVRRDDVVTLSTLNGEYRYQVVSTRIVSPSDVTVLAATDEEVLTLVTCYPFYFVGPAPSRIHRAGAANRVTFVRAEAQRSAAGHIRCWYFVWYPVLVWPRHGRSPSRYHSSFWRRRNGPAVPASPRQFAAAWNWLRPARPMRGSVNCAVRSGFRALRRN